MPCFEAMGSTITHVGEAGAGQTVKLSNQILCVVNMLAASEALLFAQAGGVDLDKMLASGDRRRGWQLDAGQSRSAGHQRLLGAGLFD